MAKALEVWFSIVAASLVYDFTILLARQTEGLPIGYLMAHVEFSDILTLLERDFWRHSGLFSRRKRYTLFIFVVFVALLCVASNLMGPATAVLVLPTLGWTETTDPITQRLGQIAASEPPRNPSITPFCTASSLAAGDFSCTSYYSPSLDELSSSLVFNYRQINESYGSNLGILQERALSFTFNLTVIDAVWAPSRQMLRELSNDYTVVELSQGINQAFDIARSQAAQNGLNLDQSLFNSYRNTLDITLQRRGPSLGASGNCVRASVTEKVLQEAKAVRCYYLNWTLDGAYNTYSCIRTGSGWNVAGLAESQFSIITEPAAAENASVSVYLATEVLSLNRTSSCASENEGQESCDWELMFSSNHSGEILTHGYQLFTQFSFLGPEHPNNSVICFDQVFSATLNYSIDTSPDANALALVSLDMPSDTDNVQSIALHPDWILAAWAVPRSGTIESNGAATSNLVDALESVTGTAPPAREDPASPDPDPRIDEFYFQHFAPLLHALTLVDFTMINTTDPSADDVDAAHPLLTVSRSLRLWAYGHSSHTFRVGVATTTFGLFCVLLRFTLSFSMESHRRAPLNFLSAALRYQGRAEDSEVKEMSVRIERRKSGELVLRKAKHEYGPIQLSL